MPKDSDLISSQTHELNYVLKKWDKKQNKENREILRKVLKDFREDQAYKPHNRESFYKYVEDHNILDLLEDIDTKKTAGKKTGKESIVPDIETDDLTVEDPFLHATKQKKLKKPKIKLHELTMHKSNKLTIMKPGEKGISTGKTGKKGSKKNLIILLIVILALILIITLFFVGRCLYNQSKEGNTDTSSTFQDRDSVSTDKDENRDTLPDTDAEKQVYTENSLTVFLKTCTPLYFKGDLDELLPGEVTKIDTLAAYLENYTLVELFIQGHTASIGQPDNEKILSRERADLVAKLLSEKVKKAELKLETKGYGAEKEAIKNPQKEKMELNRRVEIIVKKVQSE